MKIKKTILKTLLLILVILLSGHSRIVFSETLYAVNTQGSKVSSLFEINTQTGEITLVGSTGYPVTDIAWDRTTGKLFGAVAKRRLLDKSVFTGLITINTDTGKGAPVARWSDVSGSPLTYPDNAITQIDIDSKGNMYGSNPRNGNKNLVRINSSTAQVLSNKIYFMEFPLSSGETMQLPINTGHHGFSFDSKDNLWQQIEVLSIDSFAVTKINSEQSFKFIPGDPGIFVGIPEVPVAPELEGNVGKHGTFDLITDRYWSVTDYKVTIHNFKTGKLIREFSLKNPPDSRQGEFALAFADVGNASDVAAGTSFINDTVNEDLGINKGHIINHGVLASGFTNLGIIDSYDEISGHNIINGEDGIINIVGTFAPAGDIINNGFIHLQPSVGDFPETTADLGHATLTNNGIFRIDTPVIGKGKIVNQGVFEITPRGSYQLDSLNNYQQLSKGRTNVDGTLRVDGLYGLLGGTLSGNGTVIAPLGIAGMGGGQTFNISPGSPIGTLTLDTAWITLGTDQSLDFEIAGTASDQYDHLKTTGDIYFYAYHRGDTLVNVLLREGFVPQAGDTFEIITARSIIGDAVTFNFPSLPEGLSWDVELNASSIVLKVN